MTFSFVLICFLIFIICYHIDSILYALALIYLYISIFIACSYKYSNIDGRILHSLPAAAMTSRIKKLLEYRVSFCDQMYQYNHSVK
jgi:hypothetical protein